MDDPTLSDILDSDLAEVQTAASVLKQLTSAWVNEKNAPELLKHATEVVDAMMTQIEEMEGNLQHLSRDDFRIVPHQMEVNRIRFILASYHRCRLEKIETFASYLVNHDSNCRNESDKLMSDGELGFAQNFIIIQKDHFHEEAYKYLPDLIKDREGNPAMVVTPNLNSSVFIRMLKPVSNILINDSVQEMEVGSRHLLPYKVISNLIRDGSAILL